MQEGLGPVEVKLVPRFDLRDRVMIPTIVLGYVLLFVTTWLFRAKFTFEGPVDAVFLLGFLLAVICYPPVSTMLLRTHIALARATTAVVDEDGLRLMRGADVVGELAFDGRVGVSTRLLDGGTVQKFWFGRGYRILVFSVDPEDAARLWPVVRAAVEKHGMWTGDDLERLMAGTTS